MFGSYLALGAEGDGEGSEDALAHAHEERALLAHVGQHLLGLLALYARVEPRLKREEEWDHSVAVNVELFSTCPVCPFVGSYNWMQVQH